MNLPLGAFTLGYLGQTDQLTTRQRVSSTLVTSWSYLNNTGDRRLAGVANTGLVAGHFSNFAFTSTPEDFVAGVTETSDAAAVYPSPRHVIDAGIVSIRSRKRDRMGVAGSAGICL